MPNAVDQVEANTKFSEVFTSAGMENFTWGSAVLVPVQSLF